MFCDLGGEICPWTEKPNITLTDQQESTTFTWHALKCSPTRPGGVSQPLSSGWKPNDRGGKGATFSKFFAI